MADVYGNTLTEQSRARSVRDLLLNEVTSGQNITVRNDHARLPVELKNASTSAINGSSWNK
jgi:hypothetical protein